MNSIHSILKNDDEISPFSTYDEGCNKGIFKFLDDLMDLKYVSAKNKQLELTSSGLNYFRQHAQEMKYLLAKYNITPADYGELASFFPLQEYQSFLDDQGQNHYLAQLSDSNILQTGVKTDQLGQSVANYDQIEFTDKAPGDLIHPTI